MIYYMIRHIATGEFMPQLRRRGYTHWNPAVTLTLEVFAAGDQLTGCPRLFASRRKAITAINSWATMPNARQGWRTSFAGDDEPDFRVKNDGRKKEDLEVVEMYIVERILWNK